MTSSPSSPFGVRKRSSSARPLTLRASQCQLVSAWTPALLPKPVMLLRVIWRSLDKRWNPAFRAPVVISQVAELAAREDAVDSWSIRQEIATRASASDCVRAAAVPARRHPPALALLPQAPKPALPPQPVPARRHYHRDSIARQVPRARRRSTFRRGNAIDGVPGSPEAAALRRRQLPRALADAGRARPDASARHSYYALRGSARRHDRRCRRQQNKGPWCRPASTRPRSRRGRDWRSGSAARPSILYVL